MFPTPGRREVNVTSSLFSGNLQLNMEFFGNLNAFNDAATLCGFILMKSYIANLRQNGYTNTSFQKAKYLTARIPHGSLPVSRASPQKACLHSSGENGTDSFSDGATTDFILTGTSKSKCPCCNKAGEKALPHSLL